MKCTIHIIDEVNCRLDGLRPEHYEILYERFGIYVDGYRYMPAFQLRRWDGKIRFFDKLGKTYTKILDEIVPYLCSWDYEIDIIDNRISTAIVADRVAENFFGTQPDSRQLRPYQVDVVNSLLDEGSGLAICATGAGKTSMCAALAMVLHLNNLQTIIIVPSSDLVVQTAKELRELLKEYPVSIGVYSGSEKDIDNPIVVATWQALQNVPHYMSFFQAFIIDECHGAKASVIKELVNVHGKHITHRYGVTGTFPKASVDGYSLTTSIGRIVAEVPAIWLIENGYLSTIEIEPIETQDIDPDVGDYAAERAYLTRNEDRTKALAKIIMQKRDMYGNTLVLVNTQSLQLGRDLQELIPGSVYLDGSSEAELRQENYAQYADQDGIIVIASAGIASVGLSIDRIFCLILLDAGKSFIKCIQAAGRGLRKKGDKNHLNLVDIFSKLKFSKKHWNDRKKYYKEAQYPMIAVKKIKY